jgi:hypothetical protein
MVFFTVSIQMIDPPSFKSHSVNTGNHRMFDVHDFNERFAHPSHRFWPAGFNTTK